MRSRYSLLPRVTSHSPYDLFYPRYFGMDLAPSLLMTALLPIVAGSSVLSDYADRYYGQNGVVYEKVYVPLAIAEKMDASYLSGERETRNGVEYAAVYYPVPIVGQEMNVKIKDDVVRYIITSIESVYSDGDYKVTYKLRKVDPSVAAGPLLVTAIEHNGVVEYYAPRSKMAKTALGYLE